MAWYDTLRKRSYCINWRSPSLSELTPMIFNTGLTHLDSEASNYKPTNLNVKAKQLTSIAFELNGRNVKEYSEVNNIINNGNELTR